VTTIADKLREVIAALGEMSVHIESQSRAAVLRRKALAALPDPKEIDRLETQNSQLHDELETRADALGKRTRERDELVAVIRRLREIGFDKNCIFCGFMDRELKKAPQ